MGELKIYTKSDLEEFLIDKLIDLHFERDLAADRGDRHESKRIDLRIETIQSLVDDLREWGTE